MTDNQGDNRTFDFSDKIRAAMESAIVIGDAESREATIRQDGMASYLRQFRDCDPGYIVSRDSYRAAPSSVMTRDLSVFPHLIRQTEGIVRGEDFDGDSVETTVKHEIAHAVAARMLGKRMVYSVDIFRCLIEGESDRYMIGSRSSPDVGQYQTKADFAFISAAPEHPSKSDECAFRALGYISCRQALETHPLVVSGKIIVPDVFSM